MSVRKTIPADRPIISGVNLKEVNGESLIGRGNIELQLISDEQLQGILNASEEAVTKAEESNKIANGAVDTANGAVTTATEAKNIAEYNTNIANGAVTTANEAKNIAEGIDGKATEALSESGTAITTANGAVTTANGAVTTANEAKSIAEGIDNKATEALSNSETALSNSNTALEKANSVEGISSEAKNVAEQANSTANSANNTANTANSNATEALTKINDISNLTLLARYDNSDNENIHYLLAQLPKSGDSATGSLIIKGCAGSYNDPNILDIAINVRDNLTVRGFADIHKTTMSNNCYIEIFETDNSYDIALVCYGWYNCHLAVYSTGSYIKINKGLTEVYSPTVSSIWNSLDNLDNIVTLQKIEKSFLMSALIIHNDNDLSFNICVPVYKTYNSSNDFLSDVYYHNKRLFASGYDKNSGEIINSVIINDDKSIDYFNGRYKIGSIVGNIEQYITTFLRIIK